MSDPTINNRSIELASTLAAQCDALAITIQQVSEHGDFLHPNYVYTDACQRIQTALKLMYPRPKEENSDE